MIDKIVARTVVIAELSCGFERVLREVANKHNGMNHAELVMACAYLQGGIWEKEVEKALKGVLKK